MGPPQSVALWGGVAHWYWECDDELSVGDIGEQVFCEMISRLDHSFCAAARAEPTLFTREGDDFFLATAVAF